ncbi:MAG: helix-hairpin-helix domain-containing protein, partial [Chloroflexota bacterium]
MFYRASGRAVALGAEIGAGGEAKIFRLADEPRLVAKVFHQPTLLRAAKLRAMLASPPRDPDGDREHISIAWPSELIFDGAGSPGGFLMPRIDSSRAIPLLHLYNPGDRLRKAPAFTWRYLLRALRNLSSVVETLHRRGYVVGDLNESNVLVSDSALITLVDCDSIQVPSPDGGYFRCTVGKPEYTPPELQGCQFGGIDRNASHDDFGLAVLAFMLLMEGFHPFAGVWNVPGDPPTVEERIKLGVWPYQPNPLATPPPYAPSFELLPREIRRLFVRAFHDGGTSPAARPSPSEWKHASEAAERQLKECRVNPQHVFSQRARECPWCARVRQGFPDPYPPIAVQPARSVASIPRRDRATGPAPLHPARVAPSARLPTGGSTPVAAESATGWYLRSGSWLAYVFGALLGAQLPVDSGFMQSIVAGVAANAGLLLGAGPVLVAALAALAGALGGSPRRVRGALTALVAAFVVLFVAVAFCQQVAAAPSPAGFGAAVATVDAAGAALLALLGGRLF